LLKKQQKVKNKNQKRKEDSLPAAKLQNQMMNQKII